MPIEFAPQKYISHALIIVMVIVTLLKYMQPAMALYGFNALNILNKDYMWAVVQLVLYQFLHGDWIHLLMNAYFLYTAGPMLESRMSSSSFLLFFLIGTLFVAGALYFFAPMTTTIGISGFCMALLAYLWIDLYTLHSPAASQIAILLFVNIVIGLLPGISMVGHAAGAVWGVLWWVITKRL